MVIIKWQPLAKKEYVYNVCVYTLATHLHRFCVFHFSCIGKMIPQLDTVMSIKIHVMA